MQRLHTCLDPNLLVPLSTSSPPPSSPPAPQLTARQRAELEREEKRRREREEEEKLPVIVPIQVRVDISGSTAYNAMSDMDPRQTGFSGFKAKVDKLVDKACINRPGLIPFETTMVLTKEKAPKQSFPFDDEVENYEAMLRTLTSWVPMIRKHGSGYAKIAVSKRFSTVMYEEKEREVQRLREATAEAKAGVKTKRSAKEVKNSVSLTARLLYT